jgi:3-hydroxyisobutyrate dehydrogenase-like beta-hydroxyacid dehydrogenase
MTSATVGVVGIGDMGMPILGCYVRAGNDVVAFDLRDEALAEAERRGARRAASVQALAADADVVAVVLLDDQQLERVLLGDSGLIASVRPGTKIFVHSTAMPQTIRDLAASAAAREVTLLDCPVTGGTHMAEEGRLTVFVGGGDRDVAEATPQLAALGTVEHVGPVGAGQVIKLTNNLMHFGNKAFLYQALELATAFGIEEKMARRLWEQGSGDSWALRNFDHLDSLLLTHTLSGTPELFEFLSKDVWTAAVVARHAAVHLPMVASLAESLPAMEARRLRELRARQEDK